MNIAIILSGVLLVNKEPNKTYLENITGIKAVEQYKIIPNELISLKRIENMQKQVVAKKKKTKNAQKKKKIVQKKKKVLSKSKKKVVTKKKIQKKRKKVVRTRVRYNVGEIQSYAHQLVLSYGWSEEDYNKLVLLWYRESSWNPNAVNKRSGACGIPQANPCSKASKGTDYRTNWRTQVRWGLNYIKKRYSSPSGAWSHSQWRGWY